MNLRLSRATSVLVLAGVPAAPAIGRSVAFQFGGTPMIHSQGQGESVMVQGPNPPVTANAYYNPLTGVSGNTSRDLIADDTGAILNSNSVGVDWAGFGVGENPISVTDGDTALMKYYLDETFEGATPLGVHSPYAAYDVYLMTDANNHFQPNNETRDAIFHLKVSSTSSLDATATDPASSPDFTGTYVEGQNFVVFRNQTAPVFNIVVSLDLSNAHPEAGINGLLLVEVPEPSAMSSIGFASLVLLRRRRW